MKALTICQPYAHLIAIGEKRVENRTWPTHYRGSLYIHAGKSLEWLDTGDPKDGDSRYKIAPGEMAFGAVVAFCQLTACVRYDDLFEPEGACWRDKYPWLREHEHTEGPWCWVLSDIKRVEPVQWRGAQGLWDCEAATTSYTSTVSSGAETGEKP